MEEVFDLATRKGSDVVVNDDMIAELQSLSTQLYYMLVMMLSDQALEIIRNSLEGNGAEVWRVALGIRAGCWCQIWSDVAIIVEATNDTPRAEATHRSEYQSIGDVSGIS